MPESQSPAMPKPPQPPKPPKPSESAEPHRPPTSEVSDTSGSNGDEPDSSSDRRSFISRTTTIIVGAVAAAVAPVAGALTFLDPLRRKSDTRDMVRVASFAALPEDGTPKKFTVLDTLVDAWNKTANVPVGSVYLQRTGENTVRVLNTVCPHLGCSVGYRASTNGYFCPCHKSAFNLDGSIADPKSPAPRGMDELTAEVRDGEVWIRFQNFRTGSTDKIPV